MSNSLAEIPNRTNEERRKPRHRKRGPAPRTPEPTNPAIDERQTRAFDLRIQGFSNIAIAKLLGVTKETIARDVAFESQRRADERGTDRKILIEQSASFYEKVASDVLRDITNLKTLANAADSWKAKVAYLGNIARLEQVALKARRQMEEVQGLLETPGIVINNDNRSSSFEVVQLFADVPPSIRAMFRERAALEKNVTPR